MLVSPIRNGKTGKLRPFEDLGKQGKTWKISVSDLIFFTSLYNNFLVSLVF